LRNSLNFASKIWLLMTDLVLFLINFGMCFSRCHADFFESLTSVLSDTRCKVYESVITRINNAWNYTKRARPFNFWIKLGDPWIKLRVIKKYFVFRTWWNLPAKLVQFYHSIIYCFKHDMFSTVLQKLMRKKCLNF
jgi:hypothetical protein